MATRKTLNVRRAYRALMARLPDETVQVIAEDTLMRLPGGLRDQGDVDAIIDLQEAVESARKSGV